jgi:hypothetical protein
LLLGANSHADTGLMRPSWHAADFTAASQGRISFTEEQRQILKGCLHSTNPFYSEK